MTNFKEIPHKKIRGFARNKSHILIEGENMANI